MCSLGWSATGAARAQLQGGSAQAQPSQGSRASNPADARPQTAADQPPASAEVVNLNSASAEELERLPGIGPTRARAILSLRAKLVRFSRLEELMRVKGIGRATFRKLRPWLALSGPTTLQSSVGRRHDGTVADTR